MKRASPLRQFSIEAPIIDSPLVLPESYPPSPLEDSLDVFDNRLHVAVKQGDVDAVNTLLDNGFNINGTDMLGSTPLHIAAVYGHADIVSALIAKGAHINPITYEGNQSFVTGLEYRSFTPLDLAIYYDADISIIDALLEQGGSSANWYGITSWITQLADYAVDINDIELLDSTLEILEHLASHHIDALYVQLDEWEVVPISLLLNHSLPFLASHEIIERLQSSAQMLNDLDPYHLEQHYIALKNLTHCFPSDNQYAVDLGTQIGGLNAEGYSPHYTVPFASDSIAAFVNTLVYPMDEPYFKLKQPVFSKLNEQFSLASNTLEHVTHHETSEDLVERYTSGETILLATGWELHAIDVVLDGNHDLFFLANAGFGNSGYSTGFNAFSMQTPLDADIVFDILNNQSQMALEFELFYDLGLIPEPLYSFETPAQEYGNCAWNNQRVAEQGLIFLELTKYMEDVESAKTLAEDWFYELDALQNTRALQGYLDVSFTNVDLLADVLTHYHSDIDTLTQASRATLIINTLLDESNISEFNAYYLDHQEDFSPQLTQFMMHLGYTLPQENSLDKSFVEKEITVLETQDVLIEEEPLLLFEENENVPLDEITVAPFDESEPVCIPDETTVTAMDGSEPILIQDDTAMTAMDGSEPVLIQDEISVSATDEMEPAPIQNEPDRLVEESSPTPTLSDSDILIITSDDCAIDLCADPLLTQDGKPFILNDLDEPIIQLEDVLSTEEESALLYLDDDGKGNDAILIQDTPPLAESVMNPAQPPSLDDTFCDVNNLVMMV